MIGKEILVYNNGKNGEYREAKIIDETENKYKIIWSDTENYAGQVSKEYLNNLNAPYYWTFK